MGNFFTFRNFIRHMRLRNNLLVSIALAVNLVQNTKICFVLKSGVNGLAVKQTA